MSTPGNADDEVHVGRFSVDALLKLHGFQGGYLEMLVDGTPAERACEMPAGFGSHAVWQVGHIAVAGAAPRAMLTGEPPALPEGYGDLFGRDSQPKADAGLYPSLGAVFEAAAEARDGSATALVHATPEVLARPNPRTAFVERGLPTLGDMIGFMMTTHEGMHLGQLAAWRRAIGLDRVI
ncbi:MAG: DinB family protein [Planctomycetota bacterium]